MESKQPASALTGVQQTGRDLVDVVTDDWRREIPDLDEAGVELTRRVIRLAGILEDGLAAHSGRWKLTKGEVNVLGALRSVGFPYQLRPTDLKARVLLTSSGISNVLKRLERNGLVMRQPDGNDGRSSWVRLTAEGAELALEYARSWTEEQIDTYRAVSPEAVQMATSALREVLIALGDTEPPTRELQVTK